MRQSHFRTTSRLSRRQVDTEDAIASDRETPRATLVGIDSHNIDDTRTRNSRPVHTLLLRNEILIVEHLRGLDLLPSGPFRFSAVPPKFKGVGTFPVRAYAQLT